MKELKMYNAQGEYPRVIRRKVSEEVGGQSLNVGAMVTSRIKTLKSFKMKEQLYLMENYKRSSKASG